MMKRPNIKETDDDLLRQQAEFLKSQNKEPTFRENKLKGGNTLTIGDVVEKKWKCDISNPTKTEQSGFPVAFKVKEFRTSHSNEKKKSIFARNLTNSDSVSVVESDQSTTEDIRPTSVSEKRLNPKLFPESIITHEERDKIHQENIDKLSQLSEFEILEAQKQLLDTLDYNLVDFLKQKRSNIQCKPFQTDNVTEAMHSSFEQQETQPKYPLNDLDKWRDIGVFEKEKLEWIGELPDVEALEPNQPYSARFDFKGTLMPYQTKIDVREALHHHGNEPERPGYTLQELYQLSRSGVLQQRVIAINTLANIINKCKLGYYDACFDGSLLQTLMNHDLFLIIRFTLDEKVDSLAIAAISCLYQLICDPVDEIVLDKCLVLAGGFVQPVLFVSPTKEESSSQEKEIKDDVLLKIDFIKGILRTDLLVRFNFMLTRLCPPKETVLQIVHILIRVARHSEESSKLILETGNLLHVLINIGMDKSTPVYQVLKLLRIISMYPTLTDKILLKINVHDIINFIEIDNDLPGLSKHDLYKLKLESLNLLTVLLYYGKIVDTINSYVSNLTRLLQFCYENVDLSSIHGKFDFDLFSSCMTLIKHTLYKDIDVHNVIPLVGKICVKWLSQLMSFEYYDFHIVTALGSIFNFYTAMFLTEKYKVSDLGQMYALNKLISQLLCSSVFNEICQNLKLHSVILSEALLCPNRYPSNLPSLNTLYYDGCDFLKLIQNKSTLPLILPLMNFLIISYKIDHQFNTNILHLLKIKPLSNYVDLLIESKNSTCHWFYKFENLFMISYIQALHYNNKFNKLMAFKILSQVSCAEKCMISTVFELLFCLKNWEDFSCNDSLFELSAPNFQNMLEMYSKLYIESNELTLMVVYNTAPYLPIDWVYSPIMYYYNRQEENTDAMIFSLQFSYLKTRINFNDNLTGAAIYCRLATVFLADTNAISNEIILTFLREQLKLIVQSNSLNFNEDILGISSFYNFYTDILTQFSAASYGNQIFTYFVLLPLMNSFDSEFRKLVWSEYLHVLKVIRITEIDEDLGMNLERFYQPIEQEFSLLSCYLKCIATGTIDSKRNPFIYKIALKNLNNFINNYEFKENESYKQFLVRIQSLKNEELKSKIMETLASD